MMVNLSGGLFKALAVGGQKALRITEPYRIDRQGGL
jgi:hypothetical protein